jgi:hypothetical protein
VPNLEKTSIDKSKAGVTNITNIIYNFNLNSPTNGTANGSGQAAATGSDGE